MNALHRIHGLGAPRTLSLVLAVVIVANPPFMLQAPPRNDALPATSSSQQEILDAFHAAGGYFTENRGQVSDSVRFYSSGNPSVAFRDDGVMFVFTNSILERGNQDERGSEAQGLTITTSSYLVRFEGARSVTPTGESEQAFKSNFFIGNDSGEWRTDVPNFAAVVYQNLYEGIDLTYRNAEGRVKYDFVIHPGADPATIELSYDGVDSLRYEGGSLIAATPLVTIRDAAPESYTADGTTVDCSFTVRDARSYGFDCGNWDRSEDLVIDPMVFSTFLGGMDDAYLCSMEQGDRGEAIATDATGSAYVFGDTCSLDFPVTPGAFNTTYWYHPVQKHYWKISPWEGADFRQMFVAKLTPDGRSLIYSSYLGGLGAEMAYSIAVDSAGNAYLTGATMSHDYPVTPGAFDTTFDYYSGYYEQRPDQYYEINFSEAFVTKLNPTGSNLVYSTYLGTKDCEYGYSIAIDQAGSAYVTGETNSSRFPVTAGAYDTTYNGNATTTDAFVTKLNPAGSDLVYSTYLGSQRLEWGNSIAVDATGNAYVAGATNSPLFPTTAGAFDSTLEGAMDIFVTKFSPAGSNILYSTLLGGNDTEYKAAIAVDSSGNAYLAGQTKSLDFPTTPGAFRIVPFGNEAFVTKLNPGGTGLVYSTFLGGNSDIDVATSIGIDLLGNAYVTGQTYSADFKITPGAFDSVFSDREGFLTKFNAAGSDVLYSTFLGGSGAGDIGTDVAVDSSGIAYVSGWTNSSDFPTTPLAFDRTFCNDTDAFVVKFNPVVPRDPPNLQITPWDISFNPTPPIVTGDPVTITAHVRNTGGTNVSQAVVRFFLGPIANNVRIDGDQTIPFLIYLTGEGNVSVVWTTGSPGAYSICVFVDPDNNVTESYETDNQACKGLAVTQPLPDLEITSADVVLTPPSPFVEDTMVQVDATVRNVGAAASGATRADFHDGIPPSPTIDWRAVGPLAIGGSTSVSIQWRAFPFGLHRMCVVVDEANTVAELNESNNMACVIAGVNPPPDLTPTWIDISPTPPLVDGTMTWLNVTLINQGDSGASSFDVVLFDDKNSNLLPEAGENISTSHIARLNAHSQTIPSFTWAATPPGAHTICAYADPPPSKVYERVKSNNIFCAAVDVYSPITTKPDYVPDSPRPSTTLRVGTLLPVDLSLRVLNKGNDSATADATLAFYNDLPPTPPFATFVVSPLAASEASPRFATTWISPASPGTYHVSADVDYDNNVTEWNESNNIHTWTIEVVTGPITHLVIGAPNHTATVTYVNFSTPLDFSVRDQSGAGILNTTYRIDGGQWINYTATGRFFLTSEGERTIEWYSVDFASNVEAVSSMALRADNSPPVTAMHISDPKYQSSPVFVNSLTAFNLSPFDGGLVPVGLALTEYRIGGGQWLTYTANFTLSGIDGQRAIEFKSMDLLGNVEAPGSQIVFLDATPPATTISPAAGNATLDTLFMLDATDGGSGVQITRYALDGGTWRDYTGAFNLSQGYHNITYCSTDNLGNLEVEKTRQVFVENVTNPSQPPPEANYKPVVAVIFVIVLAAAGAWSSRRRPWKGGKAVANAFMITSLPFVVAEAVTGIVSLLTGQLSMPPLLGLGTAIDTGVLISGLAVAMFRAMRKQV